MARVFQDRARQLQLGLGGLILAQIRRKIGRRVIARVEALARHVAKKSDRGLGTFRGLGAAGPERLIVAGLVEGLNRRLLSLAVDVPGKISGNQFLQFGVLLKGTGGRKFRG